MAELTGTILDGYRLIRPLGSGGFGEVWLCRNEAMEDLRAIKLVPANDGDKLAKEQEAMQRFRKAAGLDSAHLVPVEHINRNGDFLFYVMPLAEGLDGNDDPEDPSWTPSTLESVIEAKRGQDVWLSGEEVVDIMTPVLLGLQDLLDAGLVHGDVKPSNILFFDEEPRLADLGLLKDDGLTRTGSGTPGFAPPSWYRGGVSDMYSAAALLHVLSTGNPPDTMGKEAFRWPPGGKRRLSPEEQAAWKRFHAVIRRATDERATERFPDFHAMLRALRGEGVPETSHGTEDPPGNPAGGSSGSAGVVGLVWGAVRDTARGVASPSGRDRLVDEIDEHADCWDLVHGLLGAIASAIGMAFLGWFPDWILGISWWLVFPLGAGVLAAGITAEREAAPQVNKRRFRALAAACIVLASGAWLLRSGTPGGPGVSGGLARDELAKAAVSVQFQWKSQYFGSGGARGTGGIYRAKWNRLWIVTNLHCTGLDQLSDRWIQRGINEFEGEVVLANGKRAPVRRVALVDKELDLALLEISSENIREGRDYLTLPKKFWSGYRVGDPVVALGSPQGQPATRARGSIIAERRIPMGERQVAHIQTDASVHSSNRGGPLFRETSEGRYYWIGVNTTETRGSAGKNFAIDRREVSHADWEWFSSDTEGAAEAVEWLRP